jgi:putative transposase
MEKDLDTNPFERLNKEIERRTDVVGVLPNPAAQLRVAGSALLKHSGGPAETVATAAALTA